MRKVNDRSTKAGACCAAALALLSLASCDSGPSLRFNDLADGAYLRGEQVTTFEADPGVDVVSAELYLDGQRVAADEFAPFELRWDTRLFSEAAHRVTLRVDIGDDESLDETAMITIDNTPPTLGELASRLEADQAIVLPAEDNFGISRIEISNDGSGQPVSVTGAAPFRLTWRGPCGRKEFTVRAFDLAGAEVSRTYQVDSVDPLYDRDCDGHRSTVDSRGDDCDDGKSWVHPGATEPPEGYDLNCDGTVAPLAGLDTDHDGVLSFTDGGDDCDDTDPATHGRFAVLAHQRLTSGGNLLLWNRGEAQFAASSFGASWVLYLNRSGTVEEVRQRAGPDVEILTVATGANPASVAEDKGFVAFGRGNEVVILRKSGSSWAPYSSISANAPVGKLAIEMPNPDVPQQVVVFQAGTQVWYASSTVGGAWTQRLVLDPGAPLFEAPFLSYAVLAFRTVAQAWTAFYLNADMVSATPRVPAGAILTAFTNSGILAALAVELNGEHVLFAGALFASRLDRVRTFSKPVIGLHAANQFLYVQLEGGELQVLREQANFRRVQSIENVGAFDTAVDHVFAGGGTMHFITTGTVHPAEDPRGDLIDRDCDSYD
jgi:Putative metal-binding motif